MIMKLKAHLTVGWELLHIPRAYTLYHNALEKVDDSKEEINRAKFEESVNNIKNIYGLDELFHRRVDGGFKPVKEFIASLSEINSDDEITFHIDVFAYAFLKNAKNFDLLIPESIELDDGFRKKYEIEWIRKIKQYEDFERFGKKISDEDKIFYLSLRKIALRKSARDEWRAMGSLLWSGPASTETISSELGLSYDLGVRVIKPFIDAGVVTFYDNKQTKYKIETKCLPVILFFLRELLGINPLEAL